MSVDHAGMNIVTPKTSVVSSIYRYLFSSAVITQEVKFPDVSFYQSPINFDLMGDVAIFRLGQNLWIDPQFEDSRSEAVLRNMTWGAYWFWDDRISPSAQASKLFSLFSSGQPRPKMEIFIDWERSYGGSYTGVKNVVAFMQEIERLMPWAKLGVYTGYYWFIANTSTSDDVNQLAYLATKPLWLAWYTSVPSNVLIPRPWTRLTFWQYGTPAIGATYGVSSNEIDMNWFNGTIEEFALRYGGDVIIPPPPTGETTMEAKTKGSPVALWSGKNIGKTNKFFPANTQFPYSVQDGTWFRIESGPSAGLWMNAGSNWQYIQIVSTPPVTPPPTEVVLTNIIEVFSDGSVNVIAQ